MNIKDAKQEIIHTIMAYTAKNEWGGYAIPSIRQRPLLLIGPPGIGKTAVMSQAASKCGVQMRRRLCILHDDAPHTPERHRPALY